MNMNHKNHTGNGLRWMEALAREQMAANLAAQKEQQQPNTGVNSLATEVSANN